MRFTGLVYIEHSEGGCSFSFRDGMPVFAEDLGDAPLLADDLLIRRVIDEAQYAEIAARVIELGPDDEDLGFCEVAVERSILSQAQVDAELERRLRGRIMQAVSWSGCRIELDGDPESVASAVQLPQDLGPLIATAVRTFCDEAMVRELLGPLETLYVRPSVSEAESVQFFELGDEDEAVLSALKPDVAVTKTIDASGGDWLESWQLVLMLVTAEHFEVGRSPFTPATERSGLRTSHAISSPGGRYAATTGVREERVRTDSVGRMPAVTGAATVPGPSPAQARGAAPQPSGPAAGRAPAAAEPSSQSSSSFERTRPADAAPPHGAGRPEAPRPTSSTTMPAVRGAATTVPSTTTTSAQAQAMPRRDPKRKLSSALQRLERNLRDHRQTTPAVTTTSATTSTSTTATTTTTATTASPISATSGTPVAPRRLSGTATAAVTVPVDPAASRAHVEQLLRMRYGKRGDSAPQAAAKPAEQGKTAAEQFRAAQDLMRDNQWPRAHEAMRKLCELESSNESYLMYQRWAALRANALDDDGMAKFRASLRDKLSDEVIGKFAYYALGHLALAEKKDDAAEKLFRKALEMDKHNKDAERHLRIIELRRKSAQTQASNKIFGIDIGKKKG